MSERERERKRERKREKEREREREREKERESREILNLGFFIDDIVYSQCFRLPRICEGYRSVYMCVRM